MEIKIVKSLSGNYQNVFVEHDNVIIDLGLMDAGEMLELSKHLKSVVEDLDWWIDAWSEELLDDEQL